MTRRQRLVVVVAFVACGAAGVAALAALGSASAGPLTSALGWLGAMTGSVEHRVRDRIQGPGRRARMRWVAPYRDDVERLRRPDVVLLGVYDSGIPRTLDGVVALEQRIGASIPIIQAYGPSPFMRRPKVES